MMVQTYYQFQQYIDKDINQQHTWNNFNMDTLLLQKVHFLTTPSKDLKIPNNKTSFIIQTITTKCIILHQKKSQVKTHQWITPFKSHNSSPSFCKTQKKLVYFFLQQVHNQTKTKIHFISIKKPKQLSES